MTEQQKRRMEDRLPGHPLQWDEETANDEILALHRQLAAEKLRADRAEERADAKSKECIEIRERMAPVPPLTAPAPLTAAHLVLLLRAPSGYEARHEYGNITPEQWGDILRVCEGKLSSAAKTAPAAPVQTAEQMLRELVTATDAFMKGGVAPVRQLLDKAAAMLSAATTVAAPVQAEQAQAEPVSVREALQLMVDRFGPCENDYIFSKRMAIQKARAALAAPALPAQAEQVEAVRAAYEHAADVLEAMNDASGDAAAYDNRDQYSHELEREHAIADCVKKVRALAKEAAPSTEQATQENPASKEQATDQQGGAE